MRNEKMDKMAVVVHHLVLISSTLFSTVRMQLSSDIKALPISINTITSYNSESARFICD